LGGAAFPFGAAPMLTGTTTLAFSGGSLETRADGLAASGVTGFPRREMRCQAARSGTTGWRNGAVDPISAPGWPTTYAYSPYPAAVELAGAHDR